MDNLKLAITVLLNAIPESLFRQPFTINVSDWKIIDSSPKRSIEAVFEDGKNYGITLTGPKE